MVQKALKKNGNAKVKKSASSLKKNVAKSKQAKVGSLLKLPNKHYREVALEERALSKAISIANEQKVAAKLIQGGGKLSTKDILQKGKELNKANRRSQVKKKLTRVEEKLKALSEKTEREGLL